jgi:UDP-N-acetylmuramoylalanine--D-glutamate ligase
VDHEESVTAGPAHDGVDGLDHLASWRADWQGLRVAVLGFGETGFAVADTLAELGARVLVVAERADPERQRILDVLGVGFALQADRAAVPAELEALDPELVVVSPGYHPDHPLIERFQAAGTPIWGDIELAWRVRDKVEAADWILVTGTNGKTTTTRLAGHLLRGAGRRAAEVGNIGVPVLDAVRRPEGFDVLVVELSSYQLHWMPLTGPGAVHPIASVCLNVADDHLDWHGSRAAYEAAKGRVYANTRIAAVYNRAEPITMRMVEDADVEDGCRAIGFDLGVPGPSDFGVVDGIVVDRAFLEDRHHQALELTTLPELAAHGIDAPHLVANVLAAAALVRAAGVSTGDIHDALPTFRIDPHRTELVVEVDGIAWIDDSKATNPHAADAALKARPSVVWVVGGLLKGVDIGELVAAHAGRLRAAVVIGVDRSGVLDALARHAPGVAVLEVVPGEDVDVMPEAVRLAAGAARPGDAVLLSPAAASMDQFADYADRGRRFADAVLAHLGARAGGAGDDDAPPAVPVDAA